MRFVDHLDHPIRRAILRRLRRYQAGLEVGRIAEPFEVSRQNVSQHLGVLAGAGLVTSDRQSRFVCYGLTDAGRSVVDALDQEDDGPGEGSPGP